MKVLFYIMTDHTYFTSTNPDSSYEEIIWDDQIWNIYIYIYIYYSDLGQMKRQSQFNQKYFMKCDIPTKSHLGSEEQGTINYR